MPTQLDFNSYCQIWEYRNSAFTIKKPEKDFTAKAGLPGVQIMKSLQSLLRTGDTTAMKVEGLFRVYVEYSRSHDWKWSGSGPCGSPKILDAAQPPLECQAFAVGLLALMIAPPPFGLGIPIGEVEVKTFVGKLVRGNKVGFVAHHPTDTVLSLPPNVHSGGRVDEALHPGFYKWENHKVVAYGGKLFDPSYGCQYENLEDMVYLEIEDYGIAGAEPVDFLRWDSEADNDETGKYYLKCKSRQNRSYYFKVRKASLRSVAAKIEYEGPFESL